MKTGLITSDIFQNHDTGPGHPEQIARVSVITDNFKKLLLAGMATWVGIQTVLNLGGAVGLLPITGIVLPFISYGGTAMVSIFIGLSLAHNETSKNE